MQVAAIEPDVFQGARVERLQFQERCRIAPRALQPLPPMAQQLRHRSEETRYRIECRLRQAPDVKMVRIRQSKVNLAHGRLAWCRSLMSSRADASSNE